MNNTQLQRERVLLEILHERDGVIIELRNQLELLKGEFEKIKTELLTSKNEHNNS